MVNSEKHHGERVIGIRGLNKAFGDNEVLKDFDLDLYRGENRVVLGKSGSGKSVLIKCIIGLLEPDSGSIEVLGKNIPELKNEELDQIRVKIGFLFQSNALYDSMTIRQNLEFPLRRRWLNITQSEVNNKVMDALENVDLTHTVDMMPSELSGGMRKRIALARTLILKPEIILYDEPTTGLDPITSLEIINLINVIREKYKTSSIIITHDLKCVRLTADLVTMLIDGCNYETSTYEALSQSNDPKIRQFYD